MYDQRTFMQMTGLNLEKQILSQTFSWQHRKTSETVGPREEPTATPSHDLWNS